MIIEKIIKNTKRLIKNKDFEILDFSFSLPYTYVYLSCEKKESLGVAMTLVEEYKYKKDKIFLKDIDDFIENANSLDITYRTLGLATINAISQYFIKLKEENFRIDIISILKQYDIKNLGMIGYMKPLLKILKDYNLYIFERNPTLKDENVISDSLEYNLLPKMDALLISGTSLLNSTIDMILDRGKNAKIKMLVGPTAQVLPFEDVEYFASIYIPNPKQTLYYLKLGSSYGIFRLGKKYVINSFGLKNSL